MDALKKNGILISNECYKQIFSVYLSGGNPLFITSDSLLNAYHVLYEESIFRLESSMAEQLPKILHAMLNNLTDIDKNMRGNPELVSASKKKAKLVVGIALRLIDPSFRFEDAELNKILQEECQKIKMAQIVEKPVWLGAPDPSFLSLDYSRYKPRGFYTQNEKLQRYFRAVSWLQSIPFRVNKNEELLAILMLGNTVGHRRKRNEECRKFYDIYESFIGKKDDWDLMVAAHEASFIPRAFSKDTLQLTRKHLHERADRQFEDRPKISDQISLPPEDPNDVYELNFRIISAYRTPSAILFQQTTDRRQFFHPFRSYPNGLEVCIAIGSQFAKETLEDPHKAKLLQAIDSYQSCFSGDSLYYDYLHALKALLDDAEPDAPDFMRNDAWQTKSCNTVLAGWAQLRHTWALQAKQNAFYAGMSMLPAGFVEPDPEFFGRMADLAIRTKRQLKEAGAFNPKYSLMQDLTRLKELIKTFESPTEMHQKMFELPLEDMTVIVKFMPFLTKEGEDKQTLIERMDLLKRDVKNGKTDKYPQLMSNYEQYDIDLEELWDRFENVSRRLEVIAHKQLRGVALNKSEEAFIKNYGIGIAGMMMYGGNSYYTPRDDAPRIIDVYYNPELHGYLHVGIARPRKIYVLYPWEGKNVLCEGAVMPYYEFVNDTRLTDLSWKEKLDSSQRPSVPKWMKSVISGNDLVRTQLKD